MGTYVIKRLLLMIPTFLAISLLIFIVLNFAPGKPGAHLMGAGEGGAQQSQLSGQQRESYRLFKEQFNLDKPVLLNTRFGLGRAEVEATLSDLLNLTGEVEAKRRIEAQDEIEDWGKYAIPGLIELLLDETLDPKVRAIASQRLPFNAKTPIKNLYSKKLTSEERALIKTVAAENHRIKDWHYSTDDTAERITEVEHFWRDWYAENSEAYTFGGLETLSVLLLDTRFAKYWGNLARLDFGVSHVDKRPVLPKVFKKLKYSVTLSLSSILLVYLISLPLGIWSAVKQNTLADRIVTVILFMLYSLPSFFVAVFMLNLLTRGTPWQAFPTSGFESLDTTDMTLLQYLQDVGWHVFLPICCLSYASLAALSRYARTGLLDVIRSDYIRTARAKGLPEAVVIIKHAARNGMIPILTLLATLLPAMIGGSVVIEVVFGIPGMGSYLFDAINVRDYNVVMAVLLISSALTLFGMLLSDLSYALVDPRITFD